MNLDIASLKTEIFSIDNEHKFDEVALDIFRLQSSENIIYREFIHNLGIDPAGINNPINIPFLPISFFKTHEIITGNSEYKLFFKSSGTSGMTERSRHYVREPVIYETSFLKGFELFYGDTRDICILALLPSYLKNQESSLIYMTDYLVKRSGNKNSGFYIDDYRDLYDKLTVLEAENQNTILLGVSYALIEFSEKFPVHLKIAIVMETGGMKGMRNEMTREELHSLLKSRFSTNVIHSEYGMTELLSQAYSNGNGLFHCPPWMKILTRDINDPFELYDSGHAGGINIIDLANIFSCSFIETQDVGKLHDDGSFEITGRMNSSDLRGCNLLVTDL